MPGDIHEAEEKIWEDLDQVFRDGGCVLWQHAFASRILSSGKTYPRSRGLAYATPTRGIEGKQGRAGTTQLLRQFQYMFVLCDTSLPYLLISLEYRILPKHPGRFLWRDYHGEDESGVTLGQGLRCIQNDVSYLMQVSPCPDSLLIRRLLQLFRPVQGWRQDTKRRKGT
jgi:hypothetical protein